MHKVVYTSSAEANLRDIFSYIAEDNPFYAEEVLSRIEKSVLFLETFPLIGTDIGSGIRIIVEPRYRYKIFCTIRDDIVYITWMTKFQDPSAWNT